MDLQLLRVVTIHTIRPAVEYTEQKWILSVIRRTLFERNVQSVVITREQSTVSDDNRRKKKRRVVALVEAREFLATNPKYSRDRESQFSNDHSCCVMWKNLRRLIISRIHRSTNFIAIVFCFESPPNKFYRSWHWYFNDALFLCTIDFAR